MNDFVYNIFLIFTNVIDLFLSLVIFMMFARAIFSFFPMSDDNPIEDILYAITEPFIIPVRALLDRFESVRNLPIDISFFITYIILNIVTDLLNSLW